MANGYGQSTSTDVTSEEQLSEAIENASINFFIMDVADMPAAETSKFFSVEGGKDATFKIVALQNPTSSSDHTKYYNWVNKSFAAGHNSIENDLTITALGGTYSDSILFPSGGGDYVIKLIATNNTVINDSKSKVITKNISKASANTTLTFTPGPADTSYYQTLPTSTSVGAVNSSNTFSFNWAVTNSTTDAKSHGFRLTDTTLKINDSYWYYTTEIAVDGAVSSGTTVTLASVDDIAIGTIITGVSSGSLSGTPRITAIDVNNKIITIDSAQTFADGIDLTFKAYGAENINKAIGLKLSFGTISFEGETLTSTVRANVSSSTTVTLGATNGISGGNVVKYKGLGVNNSSSNLITSVTPDPDGTDTDGSMVVQLAQTLTAGTKLTFAGSHKIVNFIGTINITKYPTANKTIHLDLEKIITLGVAS